jgi:hypothetical protein
MSIQCCYSYCGFIHFQFFLATLLVVAFLEWDLLAADFLVPLEAFLVTLLAAALTGEAPAAAPAAGATAGALLAAAFFEAGLLVADFLEILLAPTFLVVDLLVFATALAIKIN